MKKPVSKKTKDISTEEKIKQAARKLFTQKGYAMVRTRDIAAEAGINLALLNYYFRSKEKLFDLIMIENLRQFLQGISVKVLDDRLNIEEKIERLVVDYIDFLLANPDLPFFILNEMRSNGSKIAIKMDAEIKPIRSNLIRQLQEAMKAGKIANLSPFHFMANLAGLTIFPFIGKPILQRVTHVNDDEFRAFMEERKRLVPQWIRAILKAKQ
ncbi:MAG: TetR/AcrR family transcriptional regulator [Chitinophagales bacterium]